MFLDSDFNGGSWGNFEEDYNNFGSMGNNLLSPTQGIQGVQGIGYFPNQPNLIDEFIDGKSQSNSDRVIVKVNNRADADDNVRNNRKISVNKPNNGGKRPNQGGKRPNQSGNMTLLESINADLNMQLQTQRENAQRSNLIMYGLLGIIAIVVLKRK